MCGGAESGLKRVSVRVWGRVQGVGYRFFAREMARRYGLCGWVRNAQDGDVQVEVQGDAALVGRYCEGLKRGPSLGRVAGIQADDIAVVEGESGFDIRY